VALPVVALVGRPNVGKSTLFNRLVGRSAAITADVPGVTRERHYARAEWCGRPFLLVDMGGLDPGARAGLDALVRAECEAAIAEADLVVMLIDGREGVTPADRDVARRLLRSGKPTLLAVNKVDSAAREAAAAEGFELGLSGNVAVSASHGRNIGELLDGVLARLPEGDPDADDGDRIKLAMVGAPNAGKSSLLNRLLGFDRALVHDQPGTTRDPVDAPLDHEDGRFLLVDTAGIRRKSKVEPGDPERFAVLRALRAVEECDVAALLIDAERGVAQQDARIAGLCEERGCGLLVVWNKWDLCQGDPDDAARTAREQVRERLGSMGHAPVLFVSARTGSGVADVLRRARGVQDERVRRVSTAEVNRLVEEAVARRPPPARSTGRPLRVYYGAQVEGSPPRFVLSTNAPAEIPETYRRYLANRLRERFGFAGVPMRISFRAHRDMRRRS
jgi:GTP-binding protein